MYCLFVICPCKWSQKLPIFMFGFLVHGVGIDSWVLFLIIHIPCMLRLLNVLIKAKSTVTSSFWSAVLILLVHRNHPREYCGPVDQETLEGSTINHQVVYQAWCRVLGLTPPYTDLAHSWIDVWPIKVKILSIHSFKVIFFFVNLKI